jgi:tRNA threonylcarbamoyladenosine biosynthesis protein TsaB
VSLSLLGIDTSTAATAVCLLRDDGESFEVEPEVGALTRSPAHGRELMPAVARVLELGGTRFGDLDAIAVGRGPGGFTGLRIGIATARALAQATGLRLRGVSSLAALAAGIRAPLALALIDARRGELFAALHERGEERWPPFAAAPELVIERVRAEGLSPLAAGDGSLRFRAELEAAGVAVVAPQSRSHVVRALHVCRLAASAPDSPPDALLPDYLRAPDARPAR